MPRRRDTECPAKGKLDAVESKAFVTYGSNNVSMSIVMWVVLEFPPRNGEADFEFFEPAGAS